MMECAAVLCRGELIEATHFPFAAAPPRDLSLSAAEETSISLHHGDIQIEERLERQEFAHIIEEQLEAMTESLEAAERDAGLRPQDLDLVLTTGGTSLIPAVRALLERRYGPDRLHRRDTFTSVASGLAIVSRYL